MSAVLQDEQYQKPLENQYRIQGEIAQMDAELEASERVIIEAKQNARAGMVDVVLRGGEPKTTDMIAQRRTELIAKRHIYRKALEKARTESAHGLEAAKSAYVRKRTPERKALLVKLIGQLGGVRETLQELDALKAEVEADGASFDCAPWTGFRLPVTIERIEFFTEEFKRTNGFEI
jgi:hypothetical protein